MDPNGAKNSPSETRSAAVKRQRAVLPIIGGLAVSVFSFLSGGVDPVAARDTASGYRGVERAAADRWSDPRGRLARIQVETVGMR